MSGVRKNNQKPNKIIDVDINSDSYDNNDNSDDNLQENMNNIYNDLELETRKNQANKVLYVNKSKIKEEDQNNIKSSNKVDFKEIMQNFDFKEIGETAKAKLNKNLKKLVNKQDKEKVTIKFDDSENKIVERELNYNKLSKEITEYQNKVKINREADVLDFRVNKKLNFTCKSLAKNSSDMNPMEKQINDVLMKNNYLTDEKIMEKENNISVDPNEVAKRYSELKKIKHLLFQRELKSKRVAKIKSKLYHKIKKKQNEREEIKILTQLQEVDPSAVKEYVEKKKLDRIEERLNLKHSLNSKFAKTIKKYNLHKDQNTKDAILENLKLKDKLMQKISAKEEDDLNDENEDQDDEEDIISQELNKQDEDIDEISQNEENEIQDDLLVDFNEDDKEFENVNNDKLNNTKGGIFSMKFMQKSNDFDKNINLQEKMKKVLSSNKKDDDENSFEEDYSEKNTEKLPNKSYARQKNVLENDLIKKPKQKIDEHHVINAETLNEINYEAKDYTKELENKVEINEEDYKKIIELENINNENDFVNKFLVKNKQNEIEFFEDQKSSAIKKLEDENQFVQGWDSWAGDSKVIQSKDYLRKKRQQERIEKFKQNLKLSKVLFNNSIDKKASNYLVKELPHPYKSEAEYHKMNDSNAGIEWNTLSMYKKLIQPSIVKKIGQIIEPMRINDNTTAKKLCDIIEKSTKKKNRTKTTI